MQLRQRDGNQQENYNQAPTYVQFELQQNKLQDLKQLISHTHEKYIHKEYKLKFSNSISKGWLTKTFEISFKNIFSNIV